MRMLNLGPGYWCYVFCLLAAAIRVVLHWVTPTPQKWKPGSHDCVGGCCLDTKHIVLPAFIPRGSGKNGGLTQSDIHALFRRFREIPGEFFAFSESNRETRTKGKETKILQWTRDQIPISVHIPGSRMVGDAIAGLRDRAGHAVRKIPRAGSFTNVLPAARAPNFFRTTSGASDAMEEDFRNSGVVSDCSEDDEEVTECEDKDEEVIAILDSAPGNWMDPSAQPNNPSADGAEGTWELRLPFVCNR